MGKRNSSSAMKPSDLTIRIIEKQTVVNALEHVLTKECDPSKRKSMQQNLDEVKAELEGLLAQQEKGLK